ncbi:MAG: cell wall-binding repeat-containing protein [Tissierellia bacterium]|nr:cell wall-binding repeat-containing protein [Tissierellia bacterium]
MFKRILSLFLALILLSTAVYADSPKRIQGKNRYETAVEISKASFDKSNAVLIVNGTNYVDALAASTLANALKSPIILAEKDFIPEVSSTEILRLGASQAIVLGGVKTLSDKVEKQINQLGLISKRIAGEDRYETSLMILDEIRTLEEIKEIFIASNEADAVASSAYRASDIPLILVNKSNPSPNIAKMIEKKTIIGGENSISEEIFKFVGAEKRIAGSNRFETATILADLNKAKRGVEGNLIVNAYEFVDAFTVSTYAVAKNMNILLTPGDYIEEHTRGYLKKDDSQIIIIGGENSISEDALERDKPVKPAEPEPVPDPNQIDPNKPMIAFTYDDGPRKGATDKLLDILKANDVKATFFVVGERISGREDLLKRTVAEGHEIGNHSYSHKDLATISYADIQSEVNKTQEQINAVAGVYPVLMRPPYGSVNQNVKAAVSLPLINWSVDTVDWKSRNPESVAQIILSQAKDGDIVLMHDLYDTSAYASEKVIPILKQRGFQFVTVSELFKYKGINPAPGNLYRSGR